MIGAQHLEEFVEERDVARIEECAAGHWLCAGLLPRILATWDTVE